MTKLDLDASNRELASLSARDRIAWGVSRFGQKAVLLSSMQQTSSVLMHLFHAMKLPNEILFVDTGFHFHETLAVRDEFLRRYGLNVVTLYPKNTPERQEQLYGVKLYQFSDGQKQCCDMRKEQPFVEAMKKAGHQLVMNGLRRADGGKRSSIDFLGTDPRFDGYKLNPILDWTDEQLTEYLESNNVFVHPLHAKQYPSIGCACCTTPVEPGEDPRAGRWRHLRTKDDDGPRYCGINFSDGSGI
jgi:phosphoadenosine phosphosulfate reductase